jgi:hypothetical protein
MGAAAEPGEHRQPRRSQQNIEDLAHRAPGCAEDSSRQINRKGRQADRHRPDRNGKLRGHGGQSGKQRTKNKP